MSCRLMDIIELTKSCIRMITTDPNKSTKYLMVILVLINNIAITIFY